MALNSVVVSCYERIETAVAALTCCMSCIVSGTDGFSLADLFQVFTKSDGTTE